MDEPIRMTAESNTKVFSTIHEVIDEKDTPTEVGVEVNPRGVFIQVDGYADAAGNYETILVEIYNGVPRVVIWGDYNQEDPTQIISLEKAKVVEEDDAPCLCGRGECPECGN